MRPRFQADADLNHKIVLGLRRKEPAADFLDAHKGEVVGITDMEVLAVAARSGRIVVSHDRRTMPRQFMDFLRTQSSPGLIIVAQDLDVGAAIENLLLVWAATEAEEWIGQIGYLPF